MARARRRTLIAWLVLWLSCMFGRTAGAQPKAAADGQTVLSAQQQPVQQQESPSADPAASKLWAVITTTGSTYFGALFGDKDSRISEVSVTTRSGRQILISAKQIVDRRLVEQLASVPVERIILATCPLTRIEPAPVREFFITGEAPFRATIHDIKPGRSITIRRLDASSADLRSVLFDDLEQIRRPPEVTDDCLPPPPPAGSIPVRILADHPLRLHDSEKEVIAFLRRERLLHLFPSQRYEVSGPGIPEAQFEIPRASRAEVRIRAGSTSKESAGITMLVFGVPSVMIGIITGVVTRIVYDYDKDCGGGGRAADVGCVAGHPSVSLQNGYGKAALSAGILGGVGIPLVIAGACLVATGSTSVQVDSGLTLSARGLEF